MHDKMRIAGLRAELSHLFDRVLTDLFVSEADIHLAYNSNLYDDDKPLADKLQRLNTSLVTFIGQEFPDRYHYIPGRVTPTFVRVARIQNHTPIATTAPSVKQSSNANASEARKIAVRNGSFTFALSICWLFSLILIQYNNPEFIYHPNSIHRVVPFFMLFGLFVFYYKLAKQ